MPFFIVSIAIQAALVIHVLKTGRSTTWIWVLVMLPLAGSVAYIVIEVLPELTGSRTARRALANAKRTIDPTADLRRAHRNLRINDSIESRRQMAEELCNSGQYDAAVEYYRQALSGLYEHDPQLLLGLARAQFELGRPRETCETLDRLIEENPDFKSSDGHLLYARALQADGDLAKARSEFEALAEYYPGAEAKYRLAVVLKELGEVDRAKAVIARMLEEAEFAAKHFRKTQKEWLALAQRAQQEW
jgi:hypothetical protein